MVFRKKTFFGIILLILVTSGMLAFKLYRQPLGPSLDLPTSTQPIPTLTTFPVEELSPESTATKTQPTATQTAAPQPLCGGPAVMNMLAIGSDARGQHYLYGLADISLQLLHDHDHRMPLYFLTFSM